MSDRKKKLDVINKTVAMLEKQHGKGVIQRLGDAASFHDLPVISTESVGLDVALGVGGIPRGRMVELFGPESCLDKNTFVQYTLRTACGRENHKGGTIQRLYERFNGLPAKGNRRGKYLRPADLKGAIFTASCLNEEDRIFHNRIVDVVRTGEKECFELETFCGYSITATADHKFYTGNAWIRLGDLEIGDTVLLHNNTPYKKTISPERRVHRAYWYVKHHPIAGKKKVTAPISREDPSIVETYYYKRLARSRAIIEAQMNELDPSEYKRRLNAGELEGLKFLRRDQHVHHIDDNCLNDASENLLVIDPVEHGYIHATERHNNLRYTAIEGLVASISPVGVRETYDIKMEAPFNNFVANNFVVHNSGKTTLALHLIHSVQKNGGFAGIVDAEHALDPIYAEQVGVNVEDLMLSQPDSAEQALEVVEKLVSSSAFDLVVVDSVAALVPMAEIEGDMGASHMGLQARLMSQACRKLAPLCSSTNTTLLWINQIRHKIGVFFGNPEVTPGGNALKFYASVRLDIRRKGQVKEGGEVTANEARVKVVKNKVSPPFKQAEFPIMFGVGIARHFEVLDRGVELDFVQKAGAHYSMNGDRIGHGRVNAANWFLENPKELDKLTEKIKRSLLFSFDVNKNQPPQTPEKKKNPGRSVGKGKITKGAKTPKKAPPG